MKIEKRASEIENSIPDFLRQLSSMLKVGLSLENALVDMSDHGKGPLYDELRRVVVEIRMGKSLDESLNNMFSKNKKSKFVNFNNSDRLLFNKK